LQQLKKDPIITKADKGNIITVLDKEWYDHKIKKFCMIKKFTILSSGKDIVPVSKCRGVVCEIPCREYEHKYIG